MVEQAIEASGERGFNVGQEVAPGVTLDAVYADRVALSRGGRIEVLKLRGNDAAKPAAANAPAAPVAITPFAATPLQPPAKGGAAIDRNLFGQVSAQNLKRSAKLTVEWDDEVFLSWDVASTVLLKS